MVNSNPSASWDNSVKRVPSITCRGGGGRAIRWVSDDDDDDDDADTDDDTDADDDGEDEDDADDGGGGGRGGAVG